MPMTSQRRNQGEPLEPRLVFAAAMVEQTVSVFGRLDAAFNNAGVQFPAVETADASVEEFDRVNAINLRGVSTA